MKRFVIYVCGLLLVPTFCLAEVVSSQDGPSQGINLQEENIQISYGGTTLNFLNENIVSVELDDVKEEKKFVIPFLLGEAEAAPESTSHVIQSFLESQNTIQNAWALDQLKQYVSKDYYQSLSQRIDNGANEKVVLLMMQNLRPDFAEVRDVRINEGQAKLIAVGDSSYGELYGVIDLVREDTQWKISREAWMAGDKAHIQEKAHIVRAINPVKLESMKERIDISTFNMQMPAYKYNTSLLPLKRVHSYVKKEAFMFVFFKERGQSIEKKLNEEDSTRKQMHVLWTGPKEVLPDQKLYKDRYPMDISIANQKDGYSPGMLNVRLPKKKPREVWGAFLYNF